MNSLRDGKSVSILVNLKERNVHSNIVITWHQEKLYNLFLLFHYLFSYHDFFFNVRVLEDLIAKISFFYYFITFWTCTRSAKEQLFDTWFTSFFKIKFLSKVDKSFMKQNRFSHSAYITWAQTLIISLILGLLYFEVLHLGHVSDSSILSYNYTNSL